MTDRAPSAGASAALGQLLLMQSVLCGLPDERSVFGFTCRGLSLLPGVKSARHDSGAPGGRDDRVMRFPLSGATRRWGELVLELAEPDHFAPYEPYVRNFAAMVALILDERAERALNLRHSEELESRVRERTQELTAEIADRRAIEEQLQRSRDMLALTLDSVPQAIFWKDAAGRYLGCNRSFAQFAGLADTQEVVGKTDGDLPWRMEDVEDYRAHDRRILETGHPERYLIERLRRADGALRWVETSKVPLLDAQGRAYAVLGVFEDITDRRKAEEERESLREQLAQAQKMESVGRLAGGVAHDFNNMLQAIIGNASLALIEADLPTTLHLHLEEILKAANRSASLTQQLLAFARKQTATPKVLDLNATVGSMLNMLRRLIGENIRLEWQPGTGVWPVRVDPVQIDQVLANLVVNARDAIRANGIITIATGTVDVREPEAAQCMGVPAGQYATLVIEDNGTGLTPEARQHLFEPFFTTKGPGRGTGLGLATVYGIVQQNRGTIRVRSEAGQGTAFTVFLPRCDTAPQPERADTAAAARRGTETLLLVEDEEQILTLAQRILQHQGYTVLVAARPDDALRLADEHSGRIHLLITDVVMPGMNGRELLSQLAQRKPGLRSLFISGYTSDVLAKAAVGLAPVDFLPKPFTAGELTTKVRSVLDR